MLLVLVCAIACGWLAVRVQRARRQREAVEAFVKLGGTIVCTDGSHDFCDPPRPTWLSSILGEDIFLDVDYVALCNCPVHDSDLSWLEMLPGLKDLELAGTKISDVGLEHLRGLTQLKVLSLPDTVTYAGMENLKTMARLERLDVRPWDWKPDAPPSNVTDRFVAQLAGLSNLQELDLAFSAVTDRGLTSLKGMTKLRRLWLEHTSITDARLENLKTLTQLEYLNLYQTKITDAGLENLKTLTQLKELYLDYTNVTGSGLEVLKRIVASGPM